MPTIADVEQQFENQGGTWHRFDQTEFLADNPVVVTIKYKENGKENRVTRDVHGGICHALSLRFIEARLMGHREITLMNNIQASLPIAAVQQSMIQKGMKEGNRAGGIKGKSVRGKGVSRLNRPFQSREELAHFLHNNEGLYEYGMYRMGGGGHSVAFDTRDDYFWFFDANSGLWRKPQKFRSMSRLYAFLFDYWDMIGYSQSYHGGNRDMHQYA